MKLLVRLILSITLAASMTLVPGIVLPATQFSTNPVMPKIAHAGIGTYTSTVEADTPFTFWRTTESSGDLIDAMGHLNLTAHSLSYQTSATGIGTTGPYSGFGSVESVGNGASYAGDLTTHADFDTDSWTMEGWFHWPSTSISQFDRPFSVMGTANNHGHILALINSPVQPLVEAKRNDGTNYSVLGFSSTSGQCANTQPWCYLVATFDSSTSTLSAYWANVGDSDITSSGTSVFGLARGNNPVQLFAQVDGAGNIAPNSRGAEWASNVAYYQYALTSTQINTHFHAAASIDPTPTPTPTNTPTPTSTPTNTPTSTPTPTPTPCGAGTTLVSGACATNTPTPTSTPTPTATNTPIPPTNTPTPTNTPIPSVNQSCSGGTIFSGTIGDAVNSNWLTSDLGSLPPPPLNQGLWIVSFSWIGPNLFDTVVFYNGTTVWAAQIPPGYLDVTNPTSVALQSSANDAIGFKVHMRDPGTGTFSICIAPYVSPSTGTLYTSSNIPSEQGFTSVTIGNLSAGTYSAWLVGQPQWSYPYEINVFDCLNGTPLTESGYVDPGSPNLTVPSTSPFATITVNDTCLFRISSRTFPPGHGYVTTAILQVTSLSTINLSVTGHTCLRAVDYDGGGGCREGDIAATKAIIGFSNISIPDAASTGTRNTLAVSDGSGTYKYAISWDFNGPLFWQFQGSSWCAGCGSGFYKWVPSGGYAVSAVNDTNGTISGADFVIDYQLARGTTKWNGSFPNVLGFLSSPGVSTSLISETDAGAAAIAEAEAILAAAKSVPVSETSGMFVRVGTAGSVVFTPLLIPVAGAVTALIFNPSTTADSTLSFPDTGARITIHPQTVITTTVDPVTQPKGITVLSGTAALVDTIPSTGTATEPQPQTAPTALPIPPPVLLPKPVGTTTTTTTITDAGTTTCGDLIFVLFQGLGPLLECLFTPTITIDDVLTVPTADGGNADIGTVLSTKVGFADFSEIQNWICARSDSQSPCDLSVGPWAFFSGDHWEGCIPYYNATTQLIEPATLCWNLDTSNSIVQIIRPIVSLGIVLFGIASAASAVAGFLGFGSKNIEPLKESQGSDFGEDTIDASNHDFPE